jgi:steroid 5-alpha reductase family enzyme
MEFIKIYSLVLLVILGLMTILWFVSLVLKNSSIVDIFWGTGFVIANWIYFILSPDGFLVRKWLIGILVTIWGLRLSLHILWRNWGKPEDYRYQVWRKEVGPRWWWQSYLQVYLLQGILMWITSAPLLSAQRSPKPSHLILFDILGSAVWLIGFFFESVGDLQLVRFKANPMNKGLVMDQGLWRYTRHPNYFGDSVQWWGYYLIAILTGGWWTIFSPILMTILLLRVSGVVLLETNMNARPGYQEYIRKTSAFIPWFPRKS